MRIIDGDALCEYANNQKDKTISANDIMRFQTIQPDAPRVMTLEEAQNAEIVWIEQVGTIVPAIRVETLSKTGTIIFAYTHDCGVFYVNIKPEHYGKVLRCWTAKPTEEQREAVKWE